LLWEIGGLMYLGSMVRIVIVFIVATICVPADAKPLGALSNETLSELVDEVDSFYKQSLELLYSVNNDSSELKLGQDLNSRLMAGYNSKAAGRCTKILITQALHQYVIGALGRIHVEERAKQRAQEYIELLKTRELTIQDLRQTNDCSVFEYDLDSIYEGMITVANPGWWIFKQDRKIKTSIRIFVNAQKPDGTVSIDAEVGGGRARGHYKGVAKRDLHSTTIQVSLLRDSGGGPMFIDGELTMTGANFQDPLTGEPAPKMPARVLSGVLTVRDAPEFTVNNAVMLVARDSEQSVETALNGADIPARAPFGTYLNLVVVSFHGKGLTRNYMKFAGLIDEVYGSIQKDNPVTNFHPTRKPLFVNSDEVAFIVVDFASDVNASATKLLRSAKMLNDAKNLGARSVDVFPFYQVTGGKLKIQLRGKRQFEVKFKSFEQLVKALFTMYAALSQEQQAIFEQHGIKKISDEVLALQQELDNGFKAMGPALDILLAGREYSDELDKRLTQAMSELAALRDKTRLALSTILDSKKMRPLEKLFSEFSALQNGILQSVATSERQELVEKFIEADKKIQKRFEKLSADVISKQDVIDACLNYMNLFSVNVQLGGRYVDEHGELKTFSWKWNRTLPRELETLFNGGTNATQPRAGS
jgi:hypothetical protein